MALKNTQYDEIMREYYRKQTEDRHEQEERIRRATEALPELAASIMRSLLLASLPREKPSKAMRQPSPTSGRISRLSVRKKQSFLPPTVIRRIILKYITTARTARTLAISVRRNATVSARPSSIFSTPSPTSGTFWKRKISIIFPSVTIPIRR